jgi:hypothetical protein
MSSFLNSTVVSVSVKLVDGSVYMGEMPKMDGSVIVGQHVFPNGDRYEGQIMGGEYHGTGMFYHAVNGETYRGEFSHGKKNGSCITTCPGRFRYEGNYVDGQMSGFGVMTRESGFVYRGDFVNGEYHGRGLQIMVPGNADGNLSYEGEFVNSDPCGQGTLHKVDGTVFQATFVDGDMTGPAVVFGPRGEYVYEGMLACGMKHGFGTCTYKNKNVYTGTWARGQYLEGKLEEEAYVYEGEFWGDRFHGQGKFTTPDMVFEGGWTIGRMTGWGKRTYPNEKRVFQGYFDVGPHGIGRETSADGTVIYGRWKHGTLETEKCVVCKDPLNCYVGQPFRYDRWRCKCVTSIRDELRELEKEFPILREEDEEEDEEED